MNLSGKIERLGLPSFQPRGPMVSGRHIPRIWVLVADEAIAKLFRKENGSLEFLGLFTPTHDYGETEISNATMGRVVSAASAHVRRKYQPQMEQSRQVELTFAREIADWFEHAKEMNVFDKLILIAAPRTLGVLRSELSPAVQKRLAAEIDKDLTKMDELALRGKLSEILWF